MYKMYQNKQPNNNNVPLITNSSVSSNSINSLIRNFNSKIYSFEGLPEPRNATEGKLLLQIVNFSK